MVCNTQTSFIVHVLKTIKIKENSIFVFSIIMKINFMNKNLYMEMPGIEPGAFHMQSERSTTEPHPHMITDTAKYYFTEKDKTTANLLDDTIYFSVHDHQTISIVFRL